ncbi:MAG: hypothetical protein JXR07_13230 [Reichenbachiella sp.]
MNKYLISWAIIFSMVSCVDKIEFEQDQYIKILGLEGSAVAEKVEEMENGDILVLGKIGVASHEISTGYIASEFESTEDKAPFIAICDQNGNIKKRRSYPIEGLDLPHADIIDIGNKTTFHEILKSPDGGYVILAQLRNFDLTFYFPSDTIDFPTSPSNQTINPLLLKLNSDLDLEKIISINAHENWDYIYRAKARMKRLQNGDIGLLLGIKAHNLTQLVGYSFLRLDDDLNILEKAEDFDMPNLKMAYDFVQDYSARITILGESSDKIALFRIPFDNMVRDEEEMREIDGSGEVPNFNEHFILEQGNNNYAVLYSNPASRVLFNVVDENLNPLYSPVEIPNPSPTKDLIRVPRAFYQTINGDFLAYNIHIPDSQEPVEGYIQRITSSGEQIWAIQIEGTPGDVSETQEGDILVVANTIYNGQLHRINLIKLNAHGELF